MPSSTTQCRQTVMDINCDSLSSCISSHVIFITVQFLSWLHTCSRCFAVSVLSFNLLRTRSHPQTDSAQPAAQHRSFTSDPLDTQAVAFCFSSLCLVRYDTKNYTATYKHNKDDVLLSDIFSEFKSSGMEQINSNN